MTAPDLPRGPLGRVAVIIPTYNERENLEPIVIGVRAAVPGADILVVDDNSPDRTGEIADKLAAADEHLHVLHRPGKSGLGSAYIAGFGWGLERGYGVLVEMDADGSHDPAELPHLLTALQDADLVIGSRWVPGGAVYNWPGTLRRVGLDQVLSQGYCFQIDLTLRAVRAGLTVTEVPIRFTERTRGASKMSRAVIAEALLRVTQWGVAARLGRVRPAGAGSAADHERT